MEPPPVLFPSQTVIGVLPLYRQCFVWHFTRRQMLRRCGSMLTSRPPLAQRCVWVSTKTFRVCLRTSKHSDAVSGHQYTCWTRMCLLPLVYHPQSPWHSLILTRFRAYHQQAPTRMLFQQLLMYNWQASYTVPSTRPILLRLPDGQSAQARIQSRDKAS